VAGLKRVTSRLARDYFRHTRPRFLLADRPGAPLDSGHVPCFLCRTKHSRRLMPAAAPTSARSTAIVTKDELAELAEWERKYADAKKKASAAEKEISFRRLALAEKVLGVKSSDEFKELAPAQVLSRFHKRLDNGDWKPERGAPEFSFQKTHEGRYPGWQKLYVEKFGETAAAKISAETPVSYSYRVEVVSA
jgi:hypothetical protein